MLIIPAPLNYSIAECVRQMNNLLQYFSRFHIDIQDGKYINNKTIELNDYLSAFKKLDQKKIRPASFDFHLQTLSYQEDIKKLTMAKDFLQVGTLLLHYSLKPDLIRLQNKYPFFSFGIVLNPEDSVNDLTTTYNLQTITSVQIMSVPPGPQGSSFIPDALNKIDELRSSNYYNKILLDGAINQNTLAAILERKNQPDCLCIGSYLTKADDKLKGRVEYLKEKVK